MSEYKLYYCPQTRCRTALWMLEEVGAPYKLVPVNVRDEIESEAFAAISPMRKVPALQVTASAPQLKSPPSEVRPSVSGCRAK